MTSVTVLLPVYNGERFLQESVAGVLRQTQADLELVVLDGGSTDGTLRIVGSFNDPRIRTVALPEIKSPFERLNRGVEMATSELVKLWSDDDVMLPSCLSKFVEAAERDSSAGMFYCDYYAIDPRGDRSHVDEVFAGQRLRTPPLTDERVAALLFWIFGCLPGSISTVMFRKEAWKKAGGFPEGFQTADFALWVEISNFAQVRFLAEKLVEIRSHPQQLSAQGKRDLSALAEDLRVAKRLRARLEEFLSPDEMSEFWMKHRGRQHIHWIARAAARGDLRSAVRGLAALAREGALGRQMAYWLLSVNGRFFRPDANALFDAYAARLPEYRVPNAGNSLR